MPQASSFSRRAAAAAGALLAALLLSGGVAAEAPSADDVNRTMMDYSFMRAGAVFFRAVDDQVLLDGAVTGMRATIKSRGGDPAKVPSIKAVGSKSADVSLLNDELRTVDQRFAPTIGEKDITYGAIAGILASLHDHWTVFMTPEEYRSLNQTL